MKTLNIFEPNDVVNRNSAYLKSKLAIAAVVALGGMTLSQASFAASPLASVDPAGCVVQKPEFNQDIKRLEFQLLNNTFKTITVNCPLFYQGTKDNRLKKKIAVYVDYSTMARSGSIHCRLATRKTTSTRVDLKLAEFYGSNGINSGTLTMAGIPKNQVGSLSCTLVKAQIKGYKYKFY